MSQALWHINPHESALLPVSQEKSPELIHIQSICSLISKGTEKTVAMGYCDKKFEAHMGVPYMEGSFDLPIKYGYSMIGELPDTPGQYFHFMHPHQSVCYVSSESLTQIPIGMPPLRASLISNMETVINAIWDANIQAGDKVLVIGFGAIGSLLAMTLRDYPGIALEILDLQAWNLQQAQELEIDIWSGATDFDSVFHVSASSAGLQQAIDLCRAEGKVIELSWYGTRKVQLSLGTSFHYGRKSIISSQVSTIPAHKSYNWDYKRRKALAIEMLGDKKYDALISQVVPFENSPHLFEKIRKGEEGPGLNWVISYT